MTPPVYAHPVIGYRLWAINWPGRLFSVAQDHQWRPGLNEYVCLNEGNSRHAHAMTECDCGMYAYYRERNAIDEAENYNAALGFEHSFEEGAVPVWIQGYVVGAVIGAGEAALHYSGWRAEKAQIVSLLDQPGLKTVYGDQMSAPMQRAAEYYQVPLIQSGQVLDEQLASSVSAQHLPEPTFTLSADLNKVLERPLHTFDREQISSFAQQLGIERVDLIEALARSGK